MGPPAPPSVKRRAPTSSYDSVDASASESSDLGVRPGPRSKKAFLKRKKGVPVVTGAVSRPSGPERCPDGMMVTGDSDASGAAPMWPPLPGVAGAVGAVAAAAVSPVAVEGPGESWEVQTSRRTKAKKKKTDEKTGGVARAGNRALSGARGAVVGSDAAASVRPAVARLVVPATAFGGKGPPRRVGLSDLVARAELLAGEVRAGMMEPTNKVSKGVSSYIEERLAGIMSLLVAATGRVENLTGECAGLRSAHDMVTQQAGRRGGGAESAPRSVAPPGTGRPTSFAAAAAVGSGSVSAGAASSVPSGLRVTSADAAPPRGPHRRARRLPQRAVLVRSTEGSLGPAEVRERLKTLVDPGRASVCVKSVRAVHGGVLVETRTEKELDFFRDSEAIREGGLTVSAPEPPRRRVGIFAVPAEITEEVVMAALRRQGAPDMEEGEFRAAVRLARIINAKRAGARVTHWVLEATPTVANQLIVGRRVFLGWHSCLVRDYVEADRCLRCLRFGHRSWSCQKPAMTCGWCAGDGHAAAECPARGQSPCCVNCRGAGLRDGHRAMDGSCPLYRAELEQERAAAVAERAGAPVATPEGSAAVVAVGHRGVVAAEERTRPGASEGPAVADKNG